MTAYFQTLPADAAVTPVLNDMTSRTLLAPSSVTALSPKRVGKTLKKTVQTRPIAPNAPSFSRSTIAYNTDSLDSYPSGSPRFQPGTILPFGKALSLDFSASSNIPQSNMTMTNWTWEIMYKWNGTSPSIFGPIVKYEDVGNAANYIQMDMTAANSPSGMPGGFRVRIDNATLTNQVASGPNISVIDGLWHRLSVTINTSTNSVTVYTDGEIGTPVTITGTIPTSLTSTGFSASTSNPINIDDIRLWSVLRNAEDIDRWKDQELLGNETGLYAYWKLNEGSGTSLSDSSGNGRTLTQSNCTWVSTPSGVGLLVEDGTTNMITGATTSNAESGGSFGSWGTATRSFDTTEKKFGTSSFKNTFGANVFASGSYASPSIALVSGTSYTFSVWIKGNGPTVRLVFITTGGTRAASGPLITPTSTWTRYTFTWACNSTANHFPLVEVPLSADLGGTSVAGDIWLDGWQVEARPYATSWQVGGTARGGEELSYPSGGILNPTQGSVEFWGYVTNATRKSNYTGVEYPVPFRFTHSNGQYYGIYIQYDPTTGKWGISTTDDASSVTSAADGTAGSTRTPDGWHHFAATWNSTSAILYIDGTAVATISTPNLPTAPDTIWIGTWNGLQSRSNMIIQDVRFSSTKRSAGEITTSSTLTGPHPFDASTTAKLPLNGTLALVTPVKRTASIVNSVRKIVTSTSGVTAPLVKLVNRTLAPSAVSVTATATKIATKILYTVISAGYRFPTFTRSSIAYRSNGMLVEAGKPRYELFGSNLLNYNQSTVELNASSPDWFPVSGATATRDTTEFWQGSASVRVVTPGLGGTEGMVVEYYGPFTERGGSWTGSFYAKGTSGTTTMWLWTRVTYTDDTFTEGPSYGVNQTFPTTWTRFTDTVTANSSKEIKKVQIHVRTGNTLVRTFYLDGLQIEKGSSATPWKPGKHRAAFIEETATNLQSLNTSNYEGSIGGASISPDGFTDPTVSVSSDHAVFGTSSLKVVYPGGGAQNKVILGTALSLTSGQPYAFSGYIWCSSADAANLTVSIQGTSGTYSSKVVNTLPLANGWYYYTGLIVAPSSGNWQMYITPGPSSGTYYFDGMQCENRRYATSWIPGGTTRQPDLLALASGLVPAGTGTWEQWTYVDSAKMTDMAAEYRFVFSALDPTNAYKVISLFHDANTSLYYIETGNASTTNYNSTSDAATATSGWYHFAVEWTPTTVALWINGVAQTLSSSARPTPGISGFGYIGSGGGFGWFDTFHSLVSIRSDNVSPAQLLDNYTKGGVTPIDANTIFYLTLNETLRDHVQSSLVRRTGMKPLQALASVASTMYGNLAGKLVSIVSVAASAVSRLLGGAGHGMHRFRVVSEDGSIYMFSNINRTYSVSYTKLVQDQRVATGRLKRRLIKNKRSFDFTWDWLPYLDSDVIDGGIGGQSLEAIFNKRGTVTLHVPDDAFGRPQAYTCFVGSDGFTTEDQFIRDKLYQKVSIRFDEIEGTSGNVSI